MHGLQRRPSGIYVARLVVPAHLRRLVRRAEFIQSTGTRRLSVAKAIACDLMATWRRTLLHADGQLNDMDVARLSSGSPLLAGKGHLDLVTAGEVSGMTSEGLLRAAVQGSLDLFIMAAGLPGHLILSELLSHNLDPYTSDLCEYVVPAPDDMPPEAWEMAFTGMLKVLDPIGLAMALLAGGTVTLPLFHDGSPGHVYAPDTPVTIELKRLQVSLPQVEALRQQAAALVTPSQLAAQAPGPRAAGSEPGLPVETRRVSAAVSAFMRERSAQCSPEHARRVRAACDLFVELMDDPLVTDINRTTLRRYKDVVLPTVPARENQLRAKHRTTSMRESIPMAKATGWPALSGEEQTKRLAWFSECVAWMAREDWIRTDPTDKLVTAPARGGRRDQDRREAFSDGDLRLVFTAEWFVHGKGRMTKQGTYREYLPSYFWLPLLGLFTGCRVNELCQAYLADIRQSATGVWFLDVIDDSDDKRLKNANSRRLIPLHPKLIQWGLIRWKERLAADGFTRLFPELRFDPAKGYSKDAVKWFSRFMRSLGLARDGRRVFHSFRHTFATACLNRLALPEATVAQLTGHARGSSVLSVTYRKDAPPDDLVAAMSRLDFELPPVAAFDMVAGAKALQDALRRKNGGRGAG